jgi:DNA-binding transcriptional ArsR family regulator
MPVRDERTDDEQAEAIREAFALLGHEVRLDILLALLENWRAAHTEPQSYSDLMRAVDMRDSGKFNYHLKRLRGAYVRKVEGGYVPTASATALYRAVLATRPSTDAPDSRTFAVDAGCPDCGGDLSGTYERSFLSVTCADCGSLAGDFTYSFPRNGLDGRTDEAVLNAVSRRVVHHVALARSGQCPFCAGTTTATVCEDYAETDTHDVEMTCDTCSFVVGVSLLFAVALVPEVTAALVALGVPVEAARTWDLPEPTIDTRSRDPLVVALGVETDAGAATIVVDEDLSVSEVTVDGETVTAN